VTYVQADVLPAIKDWLNDRLTPEVRLNVPDRWTTASDPVLVVADDGGPVQWPIRSEHIVRLTAYGSGRTEVRAIAAKAAGLLGYGRPAGIAYIDSQMGSILDARDSETGAYLASVLVTVQAKTVEV
jgi:hypothetical protein